MSGQIFISYRRGDTSYPAAHLYERLSTHFAQNQIFMDIDNLEPGVDFVEAIERSVSSCDVLIAVIGKRWLGAADEEGKRRLDNPEDFVRTEIGTALKRGIRVIPVLVEGASMPRAAELPDDLKALVRRQALPVSPDRFRDDSARLIGAVERALENARVELQRKREEQERVKVERREREENERLEAEHRQKEAPERLEAERREIKRPQQEERKRLEAERQKQMEGSAIPVEADQAASGKVLAILKKRWPLLLGVGTIVAIFLLSFGLFNHPATSPVVSSTEWFAEAKHYLDAKDYAQALPFLQKAAAAGNVTALRSLGLLYQNGQGVAQDYAQARQWFQKAADKGNTDAMTDLGYLYEKGRGVAQDYAQARQWYQKAAEAGNADAMYRLGSLYENGRGVPPDDAQARQWYQKAADKGNASAMVNLGLLYENGQGGDRDYAQARQWFQKAAEAGDTHAMSHLGYLYEHGWGVTQDYAQAREWFQKAADGGNADAKQALSRLPSK